LATPTARFDALAKATYIADGVELCEEVARRADIRLAHPFLDVPLVELMSELSPRALLHADRLRGLFRLATRGHVPTRVRLRATKANFLNAWRETLTAAGGKKILEDLATVTECTKLDIVEPASFRAKFTHLERDEMTWTELWPILGIEGFLRARAALRGA
ncbi:MAG: asparagine synthase-related protein, partial [Polyangiaceae bacterium]